jgi:anti-sigma B factor antagonist
MDIVKKKIAPGIVALEMKGSIYAGPDCRQINLEVESLIRDQDTRVVFDLTGICHVDSAGLGEMVRCLSRLKAAGGTLRLAGAHGMVEGVLKLTQINRAIAIYPTVSDAVAEFLPAGGTRPSA